MYSINNRNARNKGITFDDLMMYEYEQAAKNIQNETNKENIDTAHKIDVNQCRENLIVALTIYLDAIGVLDFDTVSEKDIEKLGNLLKDFENEVTEMMTIINMIIDNSDSDGAADVIVKSNKTDVTDILADVLAKLG